MVGVRNGLCLCELRCPCGVVVVGTAVVVDGMRDNGDEDGHCATEDVD